MRAGKMQQHDLDSSSSKPHKAIKLISISVAPAELIDKITILELKNERMVDPKKLENVVRELAILREVEDQHIPKDAIVVTLVRRLKEVNGRIWDLEERIRACESEGDFGERFVLASRQIHRSNGERAAVKKEINLHLGSTILEEKSYSI
jgi:hypothetical protein